MCVLFIFFFKVGVNNMHEAIENDPLEKEREIGVAGPKGEN